MDPIIPSGLVTTRTLAGIPLDACLVLGLAVGALWVLLGSWHVVWVSIPLWGFLRSHAARDPLFLRLWAGQLVFARGYLHG